MNTLSLGISVISRLIATFCGTMALTGHLSPLPAAVPEALHEPPLSPLSALVLLVLLAVILLLRSRIRAREAELTRLTENLRHLEETHRRESAGQTQAMALLRRDRTRFLNFMQHLPGPAFIHDAAGTIVFANQRYHQELDMVFEEAVGRSLADHLPPDLYARFHDQDLEVLREDRPLNYEDRLSLPDGQTIIYLTTKFPLPREDGACDVGGIALDITRRKTMEEQLRAGEARFRTLFEEAPVALLEQDYSPLREAIERLRARGIPDLPRHIHDHPEDIGDLIQDVRTIDVNRLALELLEARDREHLEQGRLQLIPADTLPIFLDYLLNLPDNRFLLTETGLRTFSGRPLQVQLQISVVPGHETSWSRILICIVDLTAVMHAEQERVEHKARLQQNQKLEAIGTLSGGIAHDFNNLLMAIMGYAEMALEEAADAPRLRTHLQHVITSGQRANNLVRQILTFSRRRETTRRPVSPGPIVAETLKLMRSSLPAYIEILQRIDVTDCVLADPPQLNQIVMNLCANAAQSMEPRGGRIEVQVRQEHLSAPPHPLPPDDYVILSMSDTGCGIPRSRLMHIFDPYFTTKSPDKGAGLGLSVVHGIIREYGGTITVKSDQDRGSLFTVYLPVTRLLPEEERAPVEPAPRGRERVLVVDDEAPLAGLMGEILGNLGYAVEMRTSSTEALELFRARPADFDLVITDMAMPGMTGEQLSQELRKRSPCIPIILCTGFSRIMSEQRARALGINAFLYKPVSSRELARTVRTILDAS